MRFTRNGFRVEGHTLRLSRAEGIPMVRSRVLPSEPSSVTVIKDASGGYFASFVVTVAPTPLPANGKAVDIDLGLVSLAVTSDGEKIAPPKFLRSALGRLGRLQRRLSRKVKGSSSRRTARTVAKAHATVADKHLDFLHKLSTGLPRENQMVVFEDLNVSGILKSRKPVRSIADAGWRHFRAPLESKAERYGREVALVNRWLTTSQRCSTCGHRDGRKELWIRQGQCPGCGTLHDRNINAAVNILAADVAARINACGAGSRTGSPASGLEAGTRLNQEVRLCTA